MDVQDILHTPSGDLVFEKGDFAMGNSDAQHIKDIIMAMPGDFRQWPIVGVGIANYLNSPASNNYTELRSAIRLQLLADGYIKANIQLAKDLKTLNVKANR